MFENSSCLVGTNKNGMSYLKIFRTSQASYINKCKNIKMKALLCNVNISVNQECLETSVTSCFAIPKIPRTTQASKFNELEAQKIPIRDEIKLLYTQNQNPKQQVNKLHTFLANIWNLLPSGIDNSIQFKNTLSQAI